jgi:hypothetical protein
MQARLDRTHRHLEKRADLSPGVAVDVEKRQRHALPFGQHSDGLGDPVARLDLLDDLGRSRLARDEPGYLVDGNLGPPRRA